MNEATSPAAHEPILRPYHPKLDTSHLLPAPQDKHYPRHGLLKLMRFGLRYWLLPVQVYMAILLATLIIVPSLALVSSIWPAFAANLLTTLDALSRTGQVLLLAPLAALLERYPLGAVLLAAVAIALWILDSWAVVDRRRERAMDQRRRSPTHGTATSALRLHGDTPYREDRDALARGDFDPLGFHRFVDVMVQLIVSSAANSPLVISLEAKWGMGKSTAMRMIQTRLDNLENNPPIHAAKDWRIFTVYFNPWKYDASVDVRSGLLSAVFEAIPRRAIRWHLRESRGHLFGLVLSALGLVLPSNDAAGQLLKRMDREARYRNEFEYDLRRILDHWASIEGKKPLLVVFVDDLDRCLPSNAVLTLETIKLFFDIPGCIFVLGFDQDKVAQFIQRQHPETDGTVYLKKLIQLNYRLPKPTGEAFGTFVTESIMGVGLQDFFDSDLFERLPGSYVNLIRRGTVGNPREVERFLNATAVSAEVVASHLKFDTDRIALSLLMMLQVRWPDRYQEIVDLLAARSADIEKEVDAQSELTPEDRERIRQMALADVFSELYRELGLFPDAAQSDLASSGNDQSGTAGGN